MSLNNISDYASLYQASTEIFVDDLVFTGDLNIGMSKRNQGPDPNLPAEIGSIFQVNNDLEVTWKKYEQIDEAAITHATFSIKETDIDTTTFKTVQMEAGIVSASIPLAVDGLTFSIPGTLKGVFLVFVNYQVVIPGNNVCYEFKTETKVAENNNDPNVGFNTASRLGLLTTTVFSGLDEKFFTNKYYTFNTSFVIDSYTNTNTLNTYVRFRCRKQGDSMANGSLYNNSSSFNADKIYSTISILRIS